MKRVAIVGAGPAGKAATRALRQSGVVTTVYDREPEAGGLLRYGYPAERMPDDISRRDTERLRRLGVEFRFERTLGQNLSLDELTRDFHAVLLAIGSNVPRRLGIEGEGLPGVWAAMDFQHWARESQSASLSGPALVIGGGDTAVDAATTALSLGASSATVAYRGVRSGMRAQERETAEAERRGVTIRFQSIITRLDKVGDELQAAIVYRGEEAHAETYESVIIAIGQEINLTLFETLGIDVRPDGTTNLPNVFVAGESLLGANRLANALSDGRRAAGQVIRYLRLL